MQIYKIGDKVTMTGHGEIGHIFCGVVACIKELRQFKSASDESLYWCALLEFEFDGELMRQYYPVRFISAAAGAKQESIECALPLFSLDTNRRCPACRSLLEEKSVYCDTCGADTPP